MNSKRMVVTLLYSALLNLFVLVSSVRVRSNDRHLDLGATAKLGRKTDTRETPVKFGKSTRKRLRCSRLSRKIVAQRALD
jgi:hypothetical protein